MNCSSASSFYRSAYSCARNLLKAGDIRGKVSNQATYYTLTNWTHNKWYLSSYHSLTYAQDLNPQSKFSIPWTASCQPLHVSSKLYIQKNTQPGQQKEPGSTGIDQEKEQNAQLSDSEAAGDKPQTLLQRFRQTYKEYGKILIGVHIFTSCIWATSFYYMAASGLDIVPLLKWIGASEKIIAPFAVSGVGNAAVAYLLYKLATPLRYMVTIGGTRVAVNVLRRRGYLPPIPEKNRLRSLVKEGGEKMKARYGDVRKDSSEP